MIPYSFSPWVAPTPLPYTRKVRNDLRGLCVCCAQLLRSLTMFAYVYRCVCMLGQPYRAAHIHRYIRGGLRIDWARQELLGPYIHAQYIHVRVRVAMGLRADPVVE